jgi:hypothetical protein
VFGNMPLPLLIALAMVGYLAAVTQSPITSFVIVMEMINGHALVISLMATALVSSRVARFFAPPLYETLAERYLAPPAPVAAAQPAPAAAAASDVVAAQDAGAAPADPLDTLRDDDDGGERGHRAEGDATPAGAAPQRDEAETAAAADAARNGPRDTQ